MAEDKMHPAAMDLTPEAMHNALAAMTLAYGGAIARLAKERDMLKLQMGQVAGQIVAMAKDMSSLRDEHRHVEGALKEFEERVRRIREMARNGKIAMIDAIGAERLVEILDEIETGGD